MHAHASTGTACLLLSALAFAGPAAAESTEAARPTWGVVHFANSCQSTTKPALDLEIAKLESFEAEAGEFTALARRDPSCAIAWWGAAMAARGNPIGDSLDAKTLREGRAFVDRALAGRSATLREKALIGAMDVYYRPYPSQIARARAYADKMDAVHAAYPDDPDVADFDGLAIIEGVDLDAKTYDRQKRAGAILEQVMAAHPENPGAPHFLIHAYDYTALAKDAVRAAEVYPGLAPASSHAQHMPSHIWSMLGDWDKVIAANRAACFTADPSSGHDPVKGDVVFDHAFDFIAYARLQKAQDAHVAADLAAMKEPPLVVVARYALERGDWAAATKIAVPADDAFNATFARFSRGYGAARASETAQAKRELAALAALKSTVGREDGAYWAAYVDIYGSAIAAWVLKDEGKSAEALALMTRAADRDASHEKHIYLENKLLPMREALGDMQRDLGQPAEAIASYEASLILAPNRYRSIYGAAVAAVATGNRDAAHLWFERLAALTRDGDHARMGEKEAKAYLGAKG